MPANLSPAPPEIMLTPLSYSQQNIHNLELAYPGIPLNNICNTLQISGRFDASLLQECVSLLYRAYPQLNTRITLRDGAVKQYVDLGRPEAAPFFDFSRTNRDGVSAWETSVAREYMNLYDAPLTRFYLFKLSENSGGLLLKTHHIISDAWTQMLINNHVMRNYLRLLKGEEPECEPCPEYALHVAAEREYLNSSAYERDFAYWQRQMSNLPPADGGEHHLAQISPVGQRCPRPLTGRMNRLIRSYCEQHNVSPFAVFYMALAIYLNRIRGEDRFCIGVPVLNRLNFSEKQSAGMYVNTLPFINQLDSSLSFNEFNEQLRGDWFDLLRRQRLPFEMIKSLRPQEGGDGRLFDRVLSYQIGQMYREPGMEISFEGRWLYSGYQAESLCIHVSGYDDGHYLVDYDYLNQMFSEQDIANLHRYIINILKCALLEPDKPIADLYVLDDEEEDQLIFGFNQTEAPLSEAGLGEAIRRVAEAESERTALIYARQRMKYGELYAEASKLARHLAAYLPAPGQTVALLLPRDFSLFVSMCAVALAGHHWLILDADMPEQRLHELLLDCGAALCLSGDARPDLDGLLPVVTLAQLAGLPAATELAAATPDALAYLVYTSGSSGRPKAVEITQAALLNLAAAMRPLYPKGAVLALGNVSFDAFMLESITALLNGRTIVVASEEDRHVPLQLARLITGYDVGFISLTPSRLQTYLRDKDFAAALTGVESVVCGGESMPSDLYHQLRRYTRATLYNQYGPSETTVAVSCSVINGGNQISIGRPMHNCRLYILDEQLRPLPVGAAGEIYIGGVCVGRGYRNAPELTVSRFIPDPFRPGEMLYKSGDSGKRGPEGEIYYLGRMDGQLKLRGYRIEPAEVEAGLLAHPLVDAAAVTVHDRHLVAFFTARGRLSGEELLAHAAAYLPAHLLPVWAEQVEALPMTGNGKVDYRRLPKPRLPDEAAPPADACEAQLLAIWRRQLNRPALGVHANYFLSGGDSLQATLLLAEIEREFGRRITLQTLYAHNTVRRLAGLLRGEQPVAAGGIPRAAERPYYPLTPAQQSFYVLQHLDESGVSYHLPGVFRLSQPLDPERLEQACRALIAADEMLRTGFEQTETGVVQRISDEAPFALERLRDQRPEAALAAFVRPFALDKPPLFRAGLLENDDAQYLLLDTHHILTDGISSALTLERLDRLYRGEQPALPALRYRDYACWLEQNAPADDFWQQQFADGVPAMALPADRPRPPIFDGKGGAVHFDLPEELAAACEQYCRDRELTPFMFLLGVYGVMLSRFAAAESLVIGSPVSGRRQAETVAMSGVFVNTLPLLLKPEQEAGFGDYIQRVKQTVLAALDHQDIPFASIVAAAGVEHSRGGNPLYQIMFSLLPMRPDNFEINGARLTQLPLHSGAVKMDLHLEAARTEAGYHFRFEYASALFDQLTVEYYGRCLIALLRDILRDDRRKLAEFRLLDARDRIRLIDAPHHCRSPYDATPVDVAMDRVAELDPQAVAVRWGEGQQYTYAELQRRAEAVAAALQQAGIKRNDIVAMLLARDGDMLAAMFGILKVGAAYLPLDPAFPPQRMRAMLETAGAKLLLHSPQLTPPELSIALLELNTENELPFAPVSGRGPEDRLNVIFTSGSTGDPKGVIMPHRAISNLLCHVQPLFATGEHPPAILCASNCVFDVFTTETIITLGLGYTCVVADEEEMLLPWKMAERIRRDRANILQLTPSRMLMLLNDDSFCRALAGVDCIILLGEPWTLNLRDRLAELSPAMIYNIYGPTETCVHNCQGDTRGSSSIHIGRPIGNCRYYLLDERQRPLPPTARGEIYIAGECLAEGYINRPDLTEQAYLPDPFFPGQRMYKTGDVGRQRADGNWECLGRLDTQLKLDGHRIEPAEIAAQILRAGQVAEAAVIPVLRDGAPQFLRAFTVPAPGYDRAAVKSYLRANLPEYMLPAQIVELDALPRNANGKTDLKALAALQVEENAPRRQLQGREALLAEIWQRTLGREVDAERSFFEQGGSSLQALTVLSQYYRHDLPLSLNQFYQHPTLAAQARLLAGQGTEPAASATVTLSPPSAPAGSPVRPAAVLATATVPARLPYADKPVKLDGVVLLSGGSGFLGAHLLYELLQRGTRRVVCLLRGGEDKLRRSLNYYFGADYFPRMRKRIEVVTGDVREPLLTLNPQRYLALAEEVETVLHAAADVRHYAPEAELLAANVGGSEQMLRFAATAEASFLHVSTVSVSGSHLLNAPQMNAVMTEDDLDIGQNWADNPYAKSKLLAEAAVARAMDDGLNARVFRVGRLFGRACDGLFQPNAASNAFYRTLNGLLRLGCLPERFRALPLELTPVDLCAQVIVLLASAPGAAFHVFNPIEMPLSALAQAAGNLRVIDDTQFSGLLKRQAGGGDPYIDAVAEAWFAGEEFAGRIRLDQRRTLFALAQAGFTWPSPDLSMMVRCLREGATA